MSQTKLPKIGLLYLDYVLCFFNSSNLKGWPRIRPKAQHVLQFLREAFNTTKRSKALRAMAS